MAATIPVDNRACRIGAHAAGAEDMCGIEDIVSTGCLEKLINPGGVQDRLCLFRHEGQPLDVHIGQMTMYPGDRLTVPVFLFRVKIKDELIK